MSCFIPCHVPLTAIPVLTIPAPVPRHRRPQTPSLKCAAHNADGRPSAYDPGKRVDHSHVSAAVQAAATAAFSAATGHESKAQSSETLTAQLSSGTATASSTTAGTAPAADSVSAVKDKVCTLHILCLPSVCAAAPMDPPHNLSPVSMYSITMRLGNTPTPSQVSAPDIRL
eukprot:GHRR01030814.1.p1 GENE.GHRR01030814.1~~GHRR01030814.1.p1  ORF type:complete len:171 (-),score=41.83 GHRR01030814.1:40-552(-)